MTTYCPRCLSQSPCPVGHNPTTCTPHPAAEELERLRARVTELEDCTCNAEEIRQLRAENQRLRDALETFANIVFMDFSRATETIRSIARAALEGK